MGSLAVLALWKAKSRFERVITVIYRWAIKEETLDNFQGFVKTKERPSLKL
jgi:hypothetical protein